MLLVLGKISIWSSLVFALMQFIVSRKNTNNLNFKLNILAGKGLLATSLISFFTLMYGYTISDFTILNVFQNSHTTKPLIYKIAAVWGNHEGSMLLWILVLSIFNYFILKLHNKNNSTLILKSLEIQSLITLGFLIFTIFTSNPFELNIISQSNGLGFNPILQDPALAIHPPLLYIGYVGFSAAFSISVASLSLKVDKKIKWYTYLKPFVLASWTFLTIGIAVGSLWAYYELGWGGWWFWDPVENASFMPWLIGTALLHSLIVAEKKKSLHSWILLLSILSFLLSVIGTFLVRSGILTSVHTFALDPSRGIYILIFTAILGTYSLILFATRSRNNLNNSFFSFFSKEGSILVNNILMIIVCAVVFLGTTYPLFLEAFTSNKISVGVPYYNGTVIPIMIPALLVMGIGPLLSWGKENKMRLFNKIIPTFIFTLLMTALLFIIYKKYSILGIIGIFLAFWIISNNILIILLRKIKNYSVGMIISHFGIGVLILGITGSSVWQEEKIVMMKIDNNTTINKYIVHFDSINQIKGTNFLALQGVFEIYNNEKKIVTKLKPENRYYPITNNYTTEVSIHSTILRDLYVVLGEGNIKDGWIVRFYYNPLVAWIWMGALIIFIGGLYTTYKNIKILKKL